MKLHTLTLVTLTALATFAALPGTAATDPSTGTATQQGPDRFRGGPGGPGGPRGAAGRLEQLDTNNDSKISKEEFLAPRLDRLDEMFSRRDDNGDGLIAEGEGRPQRADRGERGERGNSAGRGQRGDRMERAEIDRDAMLACIKKQVPDFVPPEAPEPPLADGNGRDFDNADSNGDNNLSLSEVTVSVTANAEAQFARLDTNGDGFITSAETGERQQERTDVAAAMRDCARTQRDN